jgi:AcrR family transcriptional regulator
MARTYAGQDAEQRHDARRARLVEAALDAFGTEGYRSTSIEQLCAAGGVSTRSFYEHFANKEELLLALHDDLNARALEAAAQAVAETDPDDLRSRAYAGVRAYFEVVTTDPRWARIALVESVAVSPTTEQHRQDAIARFAALIELEGRRLAEAGLLPARDYRLTSIALVGAINNLVNTWTSTPDWASRLEEVVAEAADLIVAAMSRPV